MISLTDIKELVSFIKLDSRNFSHWINLYCNILEKRDIRRVPSNFERHNITQIALNA